MKSIWEFWENVDRSGECWLWTAGTDATNYGTLRWNGKKDRTHRVSWTLANGPVPRGMHVLHHCDVKLCVRPDHLFLGTQGDNNRDMWSKHRENMCGLFKLRGEQHARSKLTDAAVRTIRERGRTVRELARQFNVSIAAIEAVLYGKTWRHVKDAQGNYDMPEGTFR